MISIKKHTYHILNMLKKRANNASSKVLGSATLGERGQVVIPKEARRFLKLKEGQRFIVIAHEGMVMLVTEKQVENLLRHLVNFLRK